MGKRFRTFGRKLAWHLFTFILHNIQNFSFKSYINVEIKKQNCVLFCIETKKNLLHLFLSCNLVKNIGFSINNFLLICGITPPLITRRITLGIFEIGSNKNVDIQTIISC